MILYCIPAALGGNPREVLSANVVARIAGIRDFAVENAKSARAFLGALGMPVRDLNIQEIGKGADLAPLRGKRPLGLLSEAGCPAIADPGAALVEEAHAAGFKVVPLVGPSSIVLALMASGLEGQRFAFCGYLPREAPARKQTILALERRSRQENETEIFIETPYRNDALLAALAHTLSPGTKLCVAADLTLATESIATRPAGAWRAATLGRRPAVFLLLAQPAH